MARRARTPIRTTPVFSSIVQMFLEDGIDWGVALPGDTDLQVAWGSVRAKLLAGVPLTFEGAPQSPDVWRWWGFWRYDRGMSAAASSAKVLEFRLYDLKSLDPERAERVRREEAALRLDHAV